MEQKWSKMEPNGAKMEQMEQKWSKNGAKWIQIDETVNVEL